MNPFAFGAMFVEPFRLWSTVWWNAGEMMLSSAQVIGYRTNPALSTRGTANQREFALMGSEKVAAAAESTQAMAFGWMRVNQELGAMALRQMLSGSMAVMSIAASRTPQQAMEGHVRFVRNTLNHSAAGAVQLSTSAARGAQRALKPVRSRVIGNVRRLGKR
jgi:hypothetical protein